MSFKFYAALAAILFAAGATVGWKLKPTPAPIVQIKEVEKVVIKIVKVTETKPDGSSTTTETSSTETVSTETTDSEPTPKPVSGSPSAVRLARYSAELDWTLQMNEDVYKPTGAFFARRISDTNAWVGAGYDWRTKEARVGLRVDF